MRHYARGETFARLGNSAAVRHELNQSRSFHQSAAESAWGGMFATTVRIARLVLIGRADRLTDTLVGAAQAHREAADLQDAQFGSGSDPPRWWYPVRRSLAAALLAQGHPRAAERETTTILKAWKLDPITLEIRSEAEKALNDPRAASDREAAVRHWYGARSELVAGPLSWGGLYPKRDPVRWPSRI